MERSLKVLIAVHHFPPNYKGGAEWRAHRMAKWLQEQGCKVKVICVEAVDDAATANLRWVDDEYDRISVRRLFLNLAGAEDPARWEYDNPWIEAHLTQYLADEQPDIFHLISGYLMTAGAIKAAKSLGIPVALTLTDFWFTCPRITLQRSSGQVCEKNTSLDCVRCKLEQQRRFRLPAQRAPVVTDALWSWSNALPFITERVMRVKNRVKTLKDALKEVDIAICPSNFLQQAYVERGYVAPYMHFLRQGLVHLPPENFKKRPADQVRVAYIGQIAPHKGVHILVDAFLQVTAGSRPVQLKIYGNTGQFPDFYAQLQKTVGSNQQIQFLGTFSNEEVTRIYEEIDVLVVPSIWYENSPNVILEAFAHQTPVIASNLGGMAELIEDNLTGFLFAPASVDDLANKLRAVMEDPAVLDRLKENITPPSTLEMEMAEMLQLYQSVLLSRRGEIYGQR